MFTYSNARRGKADKDRMRRRAVPAFESLDPRRLMSASVATDTPVEVNDHAASAQTAAPPSAPDTIGAPRFSR